VLANIANALFPRGPARLEQRKGNVVTPDFDVIIVGSGPAGVSAAFPLVEAGLKVLMLDGGKQPDIQPPEMDFLSARINDTEQWKWMVGKDFHALKMRDAVSPKLRVPSHAFAFNGFERSNKIEGKDFISIGSLATGGLSNSWGCGVARFSATEIAKFPFSASELELSYRRVSQRMGISGRANDDLSDYFGLDEEAQPAIQMDMLHTHLSQHYLNHRKKLNSQGFRLGRSRVAVLSEDMAGRQACNLSGNCLWGCRRHSLYSAVDELTELDKHENFTKISGFVVDDLTHSDGYRSVSGQNTSVNERQTITANKVVLAAGTLATTRIVLKALDYRDTVPLLSCPTAAFLLWLPRLLGVPRLSGFSLGQLSFALALHDNINAFGSTFSTTGIPLSEFVRHVPLRRRYSIDLLRGLLSSCVVGNIFLPGHLTVAGATLGRDGSLLISGKYDDKVMPLMDETAKKLRKAYWNMGAILLPGSFTVGRPGGDIHYAGTLPMRKSAAIGETSALGEVKGMEGVYVVDGACLPVLPEKSHTLTIMANADRIGRQLAVENLN
jgi:choline dehydrogenase-like flavoprotein